MIEVKNLFVKMGEKPILSDVHFKMEKREIIGIVGASGSGKSMMMKSLMGLLPYGATVEGRIRYEGEDFINIEDMNPTDKRKTLCMLPQDSLNGLHPYETIETQMEKTFRLHGLRGGREKIERIFDELGLPAEESFLCSYARSLSGGMRQRVAIALCLATEPHILIADEPTTSLDAINQAKFLRILKKLHKDYELSLIVVSHNVALVAQLAEKLWVVHQGRIIEEGRTGDILMSPQDPHTKRLVQGAKGLYGGGV